MILNVNTFGRNLLIAIKVSATKLPMRLGIYAVDRMNPDVFYFKQTCELTKPYHSLDMEFPLTPRKLSFVLWDESTGILREPEISAAIETKPLKTLSRLLTHNDRTWTEFAGKLATNLRKLKPGQKVRGAGHTVYIFDVIKNLRGEPEATPARTDLNSDDIEVSKDVLLPCSVYSALCILDHEKAHNKFHKDVINLGDQHEFEADKEGLKIYLYSGFPCSQAIFAFTKIFTDTPVNNERTAASDEYIDEFKQTGRIS